MSDFAVLCEGFHIAEAESCCRCCCCALTLDMTLADMSRPSSSPVAAFISRPYSPISTSSSGMMIATMRVADVEVKSTNKFHIGHEDARRSSRTRPCF